MKWFLTVFVCGCSFSGGPSDSLIDASTSDSIDASEFDASPRGLGPWTVPQEVTFVNPNPVAQYDDPHLLDDQRVLFSETIGGVESAHVAKFNPATGVIGEAAEIDGNNFPPTLTTPWLSNDGTVFVYAGDAGGNNDLFHTTTSDGLTDFETPTNEWFVNINTTSNEGMGALSQDLLSLVYASTVNTGDANIYVSTRASASVPFPTGTLLDVVNSPIDDVAPQFSENNAVLVFNRRDAPGNEATSELFMAERGSLGLGEPAPQVELNLPALNDSDPTISADLKLIMFTSTRGASGEQQLFYSTRSEL